MPRDPLSSAPRRWPPSAALMLAGVLVFLVLPNPLRIPQNNPTASAEYAPVPGKQEQAQNANFGETGLATSPGIGAGGDAEGAVQGQGIVPPPQFKPRQKNCVGNPPRQTEDPLSPPCVPFFDGDNGGSTFHGVSADEIKVVFYNDLSVTGDMNAPWKPSDEKSNHQASLYGQDTYLVRTIKAQIRYFTARYQTYGRRVRVTAQASSGLAASCAQRQGDAQVTKAEFDPFAIVHLGDNGQCYMEYLAQKYKIPSFGLNSDVKRARYEDNRPFVWGFFPDQEAESAWSASFICRKLKGGTAKFTTDPLVRGKPRKFGFIRPRNSARGPEFEQLAELLVSNLKKECNMEFDAEEVFNNSGAGAGGQEAAGIMTRFKTEDITTVVCYCVPIESEETVPIMQNTAAASNYRPEWYWDHTSRMFRAIWNQTHSDPKQPGFGVNHHWRNPAYHEQYAYQAYSSQEPGTAPNVRFNFDIYHLFLNLFQAIQAAGPQLTPESVERGMFTFNYLNRANPFIPIGGYGPYGTKAVATYNFVDTAMGWWWDPAGTPPGGQQGEGCIRVMRQGLRFYAGEWPGGDEDLFTSDAPCSQDDTKIAEAQPGDF